MTRCVSILFVLLLTRFGLGCVVDVNATIPDAIYSTLINSGFYLLSDAATACKGDSSCHGVSYNSGNFYFETRTGSIATSVGDISWPCKIAVLALDYKTDIVNEATGKFVFTVTAYDNTSKLVPEYDVPYLVATQDVSNALNGSDYVGLPSDGFPGYILAYTGKTVHTITIFDDNCVEVDEEFFLSLSATDSTISVRDSDPASYGVQVTIRNDDTAVITLAGSAFGTSLLEAYEDVASVASQEFLFTLTSSQCIDTFINVQTNGGSAIAGVSAGTGADFAFRAQVGNFTVPTAYVLTVPTFADFLVEKDEIFFFDFVDGTHGRALNFVTGTRITATIKNDDTAYASISDTTVASVVEATKNYLFDIVLSHTIDTAVTFTCQTRDSSASAVSGDYQAVTYSFNSTHGTTKCTVPVFGDTVVELDEYFFVDLTVQDFGRAIFVNHSSGFGNITNNDNGRVSLHNPALVSLETSTLTSTPFVFDVALTFPVDTEVVINLATRDGTALAASDYQQLVSTRTLASMVVTDTVTVYVTGDDVVELDEAFFVDATLATVHSRSVLFQGGPAFRTSMTATITNDDTTTIDLITIGASTMPEGSVGAGGTRYWSFSITLTNPVDFQPLYKTTDGTAKAASDFQGISPSVAAPVNGLRTLVRSIAISSDAVVELDEVFVIELLPSTFSRAVVFRTSSISATITNDDTGILSVFPPAGPLVEGSQFVFTVSLSHTVDVAIDASTFTNPLTAIATSDYVSQANLKQTFPANSAPGFTMPYTISTVGDAVVELQESFDLVLSAVNSVLNGRAISAGGTGARATILDDDTATLSFSVGTPSVSEGAAGSTSGIVFTVSLTKTVDTDIVFSINNGASTGDYQAVSTTSTLAAASSSLLFTTVVTGDNTVELDEVFTVSVGLSNLHSRAVTATGVATQLTGTIVNDDSAVVSVTVAAPGQTYEDSGQGITYTVVLSNPVDTDVSVSVTTTFATAVASDLAAYSMPHTLPSSSVLAHADTPVVGTVPVLTDNVVELNEYFFVSIAPTNVHTRAVFTSTVSAAGSILNDDTATISIASVTAASSTANFVFVVSLSNPVDTAIQPLLSTSANTALAVSDFTATSAAVNLPSAPQFTVPVVADTCVERDETFFVDASAAGLHSRAVSVVGAHAVGTITEDMTATLSVSSFTGTTRGAAGTSAAYTFQVALSHCVDTTVSMNVATTANTATAAGDYLAIPGTVISFPPVAGASSTPVTVTVSGTSVFEPIETFFVDLTSLNSHSRPVQIATSRGTGTIPASGAACAPVLTAPANGILLGGTCATTLGANCTFTCNVGYTLLGSHTRICQADTTYSGDTAACVLGTTPYPAVVRFNLQGNQSVPVVATLQVLFNKPLILPPPPVLIVRGPNGAVISGTETWDALNPNGAYVEFKPVPALASATFYTVTAQNVRDAILLNRFDDSQPFGSFFTVDSTAPYVVSTVPTQGQGGVAVTVAVVVTFNKAMNRTSAQRAFSMARTDLTTPATVAGSFSWDSLSQKMTFTPTLALEFTAFYSFTVSGAIDAVGNAQATGVTIAFRTRDIKQPTLIEITPYNNAIDVPLTSYVTLVFDKEMDSSSVERAFTLTGAGDAFPRSGFFSSEITKHNFTFIPTTSLASLTVYTVVVASTAQDSSLNQLPLTVTTTFTTIDKTAPIVISLTPASGSLGQPYTVTIRVIFSKPMRSTINPSMLTLTLLGGAAVPLSLVWTNSSVLEATNTVALGNFKVYSAALNPTLFLDLPGNQLLNAVSTLFTTRDLTFPVVLSVNPSSITVSVSAAVTVVFTKAMNPSTTSAAVTVSLGATVLSTQYTFITQTQLQVTPTGSWPGGVTLTVKVATTAQDLSGNTVQTAWVSTFDTLSTAPPVVSSTVPADGASAVLITTSVVFNFDKAMDQTSTTAAFTLTDPNGVTIAGTGTFPTTQQFSFQPSASLVGSTVYTATLTTGARDTNLNGLAATVAISFTTQDLTRPVLVIALPKDTAKGILQNAVVDVTFSEPIQVSGIANGVTLVCGGSPISTTLTASGDRTNFILTPTALLASFTTCNIFILPQFLFDDAGNGLNGATTQTFTTLDLSAPRAVSISPTDKQGNVAQSPTITITFNLAMDPTTTIPAVSITPTATFNSNFDATFKILTLTVTSTLPPVTWHTVKIAKTATSQGTGRTFEDDYFSTFKTLRLTPSVVTLNPTSGTALTPFAITGSEYQDCTCANITFDGIPSIGTAVVDATYTQVSGCLSPRAFAAGDVIVIRVTLEGLSSSLSTATFKVIPVINVVDPLFGPGPTEVTMTGLGFHSAFCSNFSLVVGGVEHPLLGDIVWTQLTASERVSGCVTPDLPVGTVGSFRIAYGTSGEIADGAPGTDFRYIPILGGINPTDGFDQTPFTIIGLGMQDTASCADISIGGLPCVLVGTFNATATVVTGCGAPVSVDPVLLKNVVVTVNGAPSETTVTYQYRPLLLSISPTGGPPNRLFTLFGTRLGPDLSSVLCSKISFNGLLCASAVGVVSLNTATGIARITGCTTPVSPTRLVGSVENIEFSRGLYSNNNVNFTFAPAISGIAPTSGNWGDSIAIFGDGFDMSPVSFVSVGGTPCGGIQTALDTNNIVGCQAPVRQTGDVAVVEVKFGLASAIYTTATPVTFTYIPVITSVTPGEGPMGTIITLHGRGLISDHGGSSMYVGGILCDRSTTLLSESTVTGCAAPDYEVGEAAPVTMVVATQTSLPLPFLYDPLLSTVDPKYGIEGTELFITGNGFDKPGLIVMVGGVPCDGFLTSTKTTISGCLVPAGLPFGKYLPVTATVLGLTGSSPNATFFYYGTPVMRLFAVPPTGLTVGGDEVFLFAKPPAIFINTELLTIHLTLLSNPDEVIEIQHQNIFFLSDSILQIISPNVSHSGPYQVTVANDGEHFSTQMVTYTYFSTPTHLQVDALPPELIDNSGTFPLGFVPIVSVRDASNSIVASDNDRIVKIVFTPVTSKRDVGFEVGGDQQGTVDGIATFTDLHFTGTRGVLYKVAFMSIPALDVVTTSIFGAPINITVQACEDLLPHSVADSSGKDCVCRKGFYRDAGQCVACQNGQYKVADGDSGCLSCPIFHDTAGLLNSTSLDFCVCKDGFYRQLPEDPSCPDCCIACPTGGVCTRGNIVPKEGYWRSKDVKNDALYPCPSSVACTGGGTRFCEPYYEGALCGVCVAGSARFNDQCSPCLGVAQDTVIFIIFILAAILLLSLMIRSALNTGLRSLNSIVLKILVSFLQLLAMVGDFKTRWPESLRNLFSAGNTAQVNIRFFSVECVLQFDHYQHLLFAMLLPFGCFVAALILMGTYQVIANKCCKKDLSTKHFFHNYRIAVLVLVFFIYPSVTLIVLGTFPCIDLDGVSYLSADLGIQCYTTAHYAWQIAAAVYCVFFVVGVPVGGFIILYRYRKTEGGKSSFQFLVGGFRSEFYYWEMVILLRKACIIVIQVVISTNAFAQSYLGIWIISIALFAQFVTKPYSSPTLQRLEVLSLATTFVVLMAAEYFISDQLLTTPNGALDVAVAVLAFALVFVVVLIFIVVYLRMTVTEMFDSFPHSLARCLQRTCFISDKALDVARMQKRMAEGVLIDKGTFNAKAGHYSFEGGEDARINWLRTDGYYDTYYGSSDSWAGNSGGGFADYSYALTSYGSEGADDEVLTSTYSTEEITTSDSFGESYYTGDVTTGKPSDEPVLPTDPHRRRKAEWDAQVDELVEETRAEKGVLAAIMAKKKIKLAAADALKGTNATGSDSCYGSESAVSGTPSKESASLATASADVDSEGESYTQ